MRIDIARKKFAIRQDTVDGSWFFCLEWLETSWKKDLYLTKMVCKKKKFGPLGIIWLRDSKSHADGNSSEVQLEDIADSVTQTMEYNKISEFAT